MSFFGGHSFRPNSFRVRVFGFYSTSPEVQTDAKPRVVKNQRTPNKAGSGSLSMERAQRGVKRAQPDTPAPSLERGQRKGRGVNTSRDVGGTAQTPASGRAADLTHVCFGARS